MKKYLFFCKDILLMTIGCYLIAFALKNLIMPHHLLSSGLTGVTLIIYQFTKWSVGYQYFILNIPLLIAGYFTIGKRFTFYSVYGVTAMSLFIKLTPLSDKWTDNPLLGAVFGGVISGIGGAMVLRYGGSTGGFDIIGRIVTKFKDINMGKFNLVANFLIVLCSAYFFEIELALYTLISIYASSKAYDIILNHIDRVTAVVVTSKGNEICHSITQNMNRGVTVWDAHGGYTDSNKQVIFSVMIRQQKERFEELVFEKDEQAFVTYIQTQSVKGNFKTPW